MNIKQYIKQTIVRHGETTSGDFLRGILIFAVLSYVGNYFGWFIVTSLTFYKVIAIGLAVSYILHAAAIAYRIDNDEDDRFEDREYKPEDITKF